MTYMTLRGMLCACVALCLVCTAFAQPDFPREARAVWVATVSNIDWPSTRNRTTAQQQNEALTILNKCAEAKINIVILQIRPTCDALYPSALEPWSEFLTGLQGRPPNPFYDPLQFWITEAHKRGIELHVWFNPYRVKTTSNTSAPASNHISQTRPDLVRTYGSSLWLDPGEPEVPLYSRAVVMDVLNRYNVDGIHFDDYFYPYPVQDANGNTIPFPDDSSYAKYLQNGGTLSRNDWRRENVNQFIQLIYSSIKQSKPTVKFGISPFGIWRPGNPAGITGLDSYASIYADSRKWIREGWCDYFTPQLYWRIDPPQQSYPALLDWWIQQNWKGRHIWPGNFTSNIGSQYGNWPASEILNQIDITRNRAGSTGNVHFSMRALNGNWKDIFNLLKNGRYSTDALVPPTPWLDNVPPAQPILHATSINRSAVSINLIPGDAEPVWLWTTYLLYGDTWVLRVLPGSTPSITFPVVAPEGVFQNLWVGAVDKSGNERRVRWDARRG
jgi:uncharacterized lipoprotein YddW (UPF0748 family)